MQNLLNLQHLLTQILQVEDITSIIDEDFAHEIQARIEMIDEELSKVTE